VNIQEQKTGDLSALLHIEVAREDYETKLEDSLRDLGRKVQLKGFRPGKVPKTLVRKIYGNQVLAEQLDNLVRENLSKYLEENKIEILARPLPLEDESIVLDINAPSTYKFSYELGLRPAFSIPALSPSTVLTRQRVMPDETMVDKEWERLLRQNSSLKEVTEVSAGDLLYLLFVELDEAGQTKPGGVMKDAVINQDMITDADLAAQSLGLKVGNTLIFQDLPAALGREHDSVVRYMMGVKENIEAVGRAFRAELTGIKRQVPAEVNQAFLDQVFGPGAVSSEEEARAIIRTELGRVYNQRTDRTFNDKLVEHLLDHTDIPLPEEFLRRWLKSQKEASETLGEQDFVFFRRNLKWSLIYNQVARDNGLSVTREEIEDAVRADVRRHYGAAFESLDEDDLNGLVGRLLQDKEYLEKVHSGILDARVFQVLHQAITISDEPVSLEDYEQSLKAEEALAVEADADAADAEEV
jgi:trigger factor